MTRPGIVVMRIPIALGRGRCACGADLAVIDRALADAISEEARAHAFRTVVPAITSGEHLIVANEDGTFECPSCAQGGHLQALTPRP